GVTMILSGMSDMEQLMQNMDTFSVEQPLSTGEMKVLAEITDNMADILPCTACRYCTDHCPQKLDIPVLLSIYNESRFSMTFLTSMAVDGLGKGKGPDACIGCRSCEAVCPQQLKISEAMADFTLRLSQAQNQ
ncbi:MAG TPA: 4Fe-4S dicluster domain-containing protein, partial [Lachnospiraceae bacterium]|nr:4Fe-4S dicluster domain-containing protein [Lachnospiraceae bacterium]